MRTRGHRATYRSLAQGVLHLGEVPHGAPDLGDEALLGDIEAALVEDEVDGLHLLHLHPPGGQRQHHLVQHLRQVLLRLLQHLQAPGTGQGPGRGLLARPPSPPYGAQLTTLRSWIWLCSPLMVSARLASLSG